MTLINIALFNHEVKVITVPHLDKLRVKDMFEFLETEWENGVRYPPEHHDKKTLN